MDTSFGGSTFYEDGRWGRRDNWDTERASQMVEARVAGGRTFYEKSSMKS